MFGGIVEVLVKHHSLRTCLAWLDALGRSETKMVSWYPARLRFLPFRAWCSVSGGGGVRGGGAT